MSVILSFNERARSYFLFRESSSSMLALVLKPIEDDSNKLISASVNKLPENSGYVLKSLAKFETTIGFLKHKGGIFLIFADKCQVVSEIIGQKILKITSVKAFELAETPSHDISNPELEDLLSYFSSGVFYYAENNNIAINFQNNVNFSAETLKNRSSAFIWNQHLMEPVFDLAAQIPEEHGFILKNSEIFSNITKGFFGSTLKFISSVKYEIGVYTRIGKKKAGTRFNSRGLDDEGNVSIFGETEIIIASEKFTFSYIILRGSVPIFWEQQGLQIGTPKIKITRAPLATQPSFDRHFENIIDNYGLIHIINLLTAKEGSIELLLTNAYEYHINNSEHSDQLSFTSFDLNKSLNKKTKGFDIETLFHHISRDVLVFGFQAKFSETGFNRNQKGIFRVNCLDCLDRTNIAQDFISRKVIDLFFRNFLLSQDFKQIDSIRIQSAVSRLFADNGDAISFIYAGTSALKTSLSRNGRLEFFDYVEDFKKSAYRLYYGNVTDKSKQETLDFILGNNSEVSKVEFFNPISKNVQNQLKLRKTQYISHKKLNIAAFTWNTGGVLASNFRDYFVDLKDFIDENTNIYVVCLQEIVQLNATQIVSSDPEKRQLWETVFLEFLDEYSGSKKFVTLVSNQLVGTSLSIFVESELVEEIKNVEVCSIKTGLGGIAGNKGSVAVRFEIAGNTFCVVGSHFTAGQNSVTERLKEYFYILQELSFSKGKRIYPNDIIFWLGDFNFRNDCSYNAAKELIDIADFLSLLQFDQLLMLKKSSNLFGLFEEMPINFAPTYKYDPGTNIYDTSEKNRVPSWTDRILFFGERFTGLKYCRAEVDVSDHKPVFLIGVLDIEICDFIVLKKLEQEIFSKISIEDSEAPDLPPKKNFE